MSVSTAFGGACLVHALAVQPINPFPKKMEAGSRWLLWSPLMSHQCRHTMVVREPTNPETPTAEESVLPPPARARQCSQVLLQFTNGAVHFENTKCCWHSTHSAAHCPYKESTYFSPIAVVAAATSPSSSAPKMVFFACLSHVSRSFTKSTNSLESMSSVKPTASCSNNIATLNN